MSRSVTVDQSGVEPEVERSGGAREGGRGDELAILAWLLGAPDGGSKEAVQELAAGCDWLKPAALELLDLPLGEWQAEHTRLFVTGYPRTACPPYESAYLDGRMLGPAEGELKDLYRRLGLAPQGPPSDYLGTMLECAVHLDASPEADPALSRELWDSHLARWVPHFCRDLVAASDLLLYRTLAERLGRFFGAPGSGEATASIANESGPATGSVGV